MGNTSKTQIRLTPEAFLQREHGSSSDHNQEDREAVRKKGHRTGARSSHSMEAGAGSGITIPCPFAERLPVRSASELRSARARRTEI